MGRPYLWGVVVPGACSAAACVPGQGIQQGGEGGAGGDLAAADQVGHLGERNPADVVGLEVVFWETDALGPVGEVDVVDRVGDSRCRLDAQQRGERAGAPAGLLLGFPGCGGSGILARVDLADGDLPAPGAGDEPVPPQQQDAPVPDGDAARAGRGADQPVLQVAAVGQLDIGEADVEPLVLVEGLLAVHGPAHTGQYSSPATWYAGEHR